MYEQAIFSNLPQIEETMKKIYLLLSFVLCTILSPAQINTKLQAKLDQQAGEIEKKVIEWRRHFHQYPELSNREFKTGARIAEHLTALGLEVKYPVAKTGAIAILRGAKPGRVVALRADIDGLPVTERNSLTFASKEKSVYLNQDVGVMHACGHDTHIAILMGVAEVLSKMKSEISGTVVFLFQPAEEGAPDGEEGGAALMIKEGVLDNPKVEAIFGLHISSITPVGRITYKPDGLLAAADTYTIKVKGRQSHGSAPWMGVDPIVVSAQIIAGLQTIVSRQTELTKEAAVITVGKFTSGVRSNIIPEEAEMIGTIRTLDTDMQDKIHEKIKLTATKIAESAGAIAEVNIQRGYPVTYNDKALTEWSTPILQRVAGKENAVIINPVTGAEDFSFFAQKVPGFFFFLGGMPKDADTEKVAAHHTPDFFIDESGMVLGVRTMLNLTMEYLARPAK